MVGDTLPCDYAGAMAVSMQIMHLDRHGTANPEQKAVTISDLRRVLINVA